MAWEMAAWSAAALPAGRKVIVGRAMASGLLWRRGQARERSIGGNFVVVGSHQGNNHVSVRQDTRRSPYGRNHSRSHLLKQPPNRTRQESRQRRHIFPGAPVALQAGTVAWVGHGQPGLARVRAT